MYGAIIGDIVGSRFEFNSIKTKDFQPVSEDSTFTDDTVMTVAVARSLLDSYLDKKSFKGALVQTMREFGDRYPNAGYGGRFDAWLHDPNPVPYNSFGNGSAMRVSPCGLFAVTLEEALVLAKASAEITHNHPEGIKGAQAVAAAVFLAKNGATKDEIRDYISSGFYALDRTVDEIRDSYSFDVTCQGSVPEAITCYLESESFEDAVRNAVSLGGDSDTQAAIAGSIAWTHYRMWEFDGGRRLFRGEEHWPDWCEHILSGCGIDGMLPAEFVEVIKEFNASWPRRRWAYERMGMCGEVQI